MLTADESQDSPNRGRHEHASESDRVSVGPIGGFAIDAESDATRMTLALKGELDLASAPMLERKIDSLPWADLAELIFDLAELTFMDSTGLSVLIRAMQRAESERLSFSIVSASEQPRKLFIIAGVADRLNVQPESERSQSSSDRPSPSTLAVAAQEPEGENSGGEANHDGHQYGA